MNCPTCGDAIPDNRLACERCAQLKSYKAFVELQRHWIEQMAKGDVVMQFRKPAAEPKWHMGLPPTCALTWCGQRMNPAWKNHKRSAWPAIDHGMVCESCLRVFEEVQRAVEVA
jgi:hypothetical protein